MRTAVAATLIIGIAACGGDDGAGGASPSIESVATSYEFDPDSWTVDAGEELTVSFTNDASIAHDWAVLELGEDIESEDELTEDKVLFQVSAKSGGETTEAAFTIDEPGVYQVICTIRGHFDAGMTGSLDVE